MDRWPAAMDAEATYSEVAGRAAPAAEDARPEMAIFGEWDTANLGKRAMHGEVVRFFEECGWRVSSYGLGSLSVAAPDGAHARLGGRSSALRAAVECLSPGIGRAVRGVRRRIRMQQLLPRLERLQAISICGVLLSDGVRHLPQSLLEISRMSRLLNKPLLCLGCSADGAWSGTGEPMVREILENCTLIAVRDEATVDSVARLTGAAPPVFGDFYLSEQRVQAGAERVAARRDLGV